MAQVPQVGGAIKTRVNASSASLDISSVPNGAWMVVSSMASNGTPVVTTPPTGWTTLHAMETTGTRRNFLFGKIKQAADGNTATFTQDIVAAAGYVLLWGTGSTSVSTWIVGSSAVRTNSGEPSGARYTNSAPSVTTVDNNCLAIAISNEATNAKNQTNEVASVSPAGWTEQAWLEQTAVNSGVETVWMGTKPMATAGATGDVLLTYVSPQDANGWGIQVIIPGELPASLSEPTVIGTPVNYITGSMTTGFTINRPDGATTGDYVLVVLRAQSSTTTSDPSSPGFTRLGPAFSASDVPARVNGFYGRPITNIDTEPLTYTFTVNTGASTRLIATAILVRGVDVTNPLTGFSNSYSGVAITGGRSVASYPVDSTPTLAIFMGASEFTATNDHIPLTTPSGYTSVAALTTSTDLGISRTYLWVGTRKITASPTPSADITWTNGTGQAVESISLRGIVATQTPVEGNGAVAYNGNGQAVKMYYTTAAGPRTPSRVLPMRRGFDTVAQMLAKPGFTWAHRGGSVSYPEHSLFAYTQSVARGYGVLEVSLGRTSDGVWFGLHDQTTDRTSGGTFGNASSQTWAQIQAQQIVIGPGAAQPYMRWSELVATYGSTHILVVDPKYALGSYKNEFLNMVLNDVGTQRAIIKYSGGGSGAVDLCNSAKALGFQTWGFFYATDASAALGGNGNLQTWGPNWTLIGMDYTAPQAVWDEAIALGKPVIGHIAPNQTAYNTAMAKGAVGVQVSGVGVVAPVSWWT